MTRLFGLMAVMVVSPALAKAVENIDRNEVLIVEFAQFVAATGYIT